MVRKKTRKIDYSIVIPVFNEEKNIIPLLKRIKAVMTKVKGEHEVVIVDNGSNDSTSLVLEKSLFKYPSLVVITLSRNFGYDGAIATGLAYSRGSWMIIMDGDQQDPPEVIPQFIKKARQGYDIVYGVREKRTEKWFLRWQIKVFYSLWKKIANINVPKNAGNFCIISREVVNIINRLPERNKFIRGLRAWTGYPSCGLLYKREQRLLGKTKFSFWSYLNHALNGITSFSTLPLRIFTYMGLLGLLLCFGFGIYVFMARFLFFLGFKLVKYEEGGGWTTLTLLVISAISINLLGFGVIGEYIGRILEEAKNRPNFLVRKVVRANRLKRFYKKKRLVSDVKDNFN